MPPLKTLICSVFIEMNDPNEGIETFVLRLILFEVFCIEMNDPNEGIETKLYPMDFHQIVLYRNE